MGKQEKNQQESIKLNLHTSESDVCGLQVDKVPMVFPVLDERHPLMKADARVVGHTLWGKFVLQCWPQAFRPSHPHTLFIHIYPTGRLDSRGRYERVGGGAGEGREGREGREGEEG